MSERDRPAIFKNEKPPNPENPMNILILYYSRSGMTRAVAAALAREIGADLEEIRCASYAPGPWGTLRAGYDSWRGHLPPIEPLAHAPSRYELVVLGGPVWVFHAAPPVRSLLRQEAARLPKLALFVTHGGSAAARSLGEMARLAGKEPVATLVVRADEVKAGTFSAKVAAFASTLKQSLGAR